MCSIKEYQKTLEMYEGNIPVAIMGEPDPKLQESLDAENEPDPMDAEQTWPTPEELDMSKAEQKVHKCV